MLVCGVSMIRVSFVNVGGSSTRVLSAGEPDRLPLLLIHGGGIAAESWLRNIEPLGQDFFVVAPDMLGHGYADLVDFSDGPPHRKIVDHLVALVDHFGWQRFAICGSSFGALISTLLYLRVKERVESLVIVGSGSMFNSDDELRVALQGAQSNASKAVDDPNTDSARIRLAAIVHDPASVPEEILLDQATAYARPGMAESWSSFMVGIMDIDGTRGFRVAHRLGEIAVRTLIVWGRDDRRGHLSGAQAAVKQMPNATLTIFDDCGHVPYIEHPARFNQAVKAFLQAR